MKNEIFKSIKDYEGIYEISQYGNVKSLKRSGSGVLKKDIILKPFDNGRGYLYYTLRKNCKAKNYSAHRLVAEMFIPKKDGLNDINHKDGNKKNNKVENLEWCNKKMNMVHASILNLLPKGEKSHFAKLKQDDVIKIKKMWGYNIKREIISDIFQISYAQISRIVNKKNW